MVRQTLCDTTDLKREKAALGMRKKIQKYAGNVILRS